MDTPPILTFFFVNIANTPLKSEWNSKRPHLIWTRLSLNKCFADCATKLLNKFGHFEIKVCSSMYIAKPAPAPTLAMLG